MFGYLNVYSGNFDRKNGRMLIRDSFGVTRNYNRSVELRFGNVMNNKICRCVAL